MHAGNKVIKMDKVCFTAGGREIIKDFSYEFAPGGWGYIHTSTLLRNGMLSVEFQGIVQRSIGI